MAVDNADAIKWEITVPVFLTYLFRNGSFENGAAINTATFDGPLSVAYIEGGWIVVPPASDSEFRLHLTFHAIDLSANYTRLNIKWTSDLITTGNRTLNRRFYTGDGQQNGAICWSGSMPIPNSSYPIRTTEGGPEIWNEKPQNRADTTGLEIYSAPGIGRMYISEISISSATDYTFPATLPAAVLEEIVVTPPARTLYADGDSFEKAGLEAWAIYAGKNRVNVINDPTTTITFDVGGARELNVTPAYEFVAADIGDNTTVTVDFEGKTGTFEINVVANLTIEGISVTNQPSRNSYFVGNSFSTAGLVISATYAGIGHTSIVTDYKLFIDVDGEKEIYHGYIFLDADKGEPVVVTVKYEGQETTFNIDVTDLPGAPTLPVILEHEQWTDDLPGLVAQFDGSNNDAQFSGEITVNSPSGWTSIVINFDSFDASGYTKIVMEYNGTINNNNSQMGSGASGLIDRWASSIVGSNLELVFANYTGLNANDLRRIRMSFENSSFTITKIYFE